MDASNYFNLLIGIGKTNTLPDSAVLSDNLLTRRVFLPDGWQELPDSDLLLLFKGLVVLEEYWFTSGEHIGSTTDTKFVYRELKNRQLDDDYSIGNWAFQLSSNPYVPLDSGNRHGAETIYDYLKWEKDYASRVADEMEEAAHRREEKKRLKAEQHAKRLKEKEIRDKKLGFKKDD